MNRALDSFTIMIPFELIEWYDPNLISKVIELYEDTGEIRNEKDLKDPSKTCRKPIFHEENDIRTRVSLKSFFGKEHILITCTSKMLKSRYLTGINMSNINLIHEYIISLNIVTISIESFLLSRIFDVDIKTDFDMLKYEFEQTMHDKKRTVPTARIFFNEDRSAQGVQYGTRERSSLRNPFVKYYSKGIELTTKSKEFHNIYMPNFFNDNLRRCEVTVANSKAVESLFKKKILPIKPTSLKDWLSFDQEVLRQIIIYQVNQWESPFSFVKPRQKLIERKISSSDYLLLKMYELLKKEDYTVQDMANLVNGFPASDTVVSATKSRIKKKFIRFEQILDITDEQTRNLGVFKYI